MAKKDDKGKKDAAPAGDGKVPRLSQHPRARNQIRQVKAWAGLVGFGLTLLLSLQSGGLTVFDAGVRALAAGMACYVIGWAIAVAVWRQMARAEVALAQRRLVEAQQQAASS